MCRFSPKVLSEVVTRRYPKETWCLFSHSFQKVEATSTAHKYHHNFISISVARFTL